MMKHTYFGIALLAGLLAPAAATGQKLPFAPGEELTFSVRSSRLGGDGTAVMKVTADTARGRDVYLMAFDFNAKVLLFKASDRTRSWFDPATRSSLRYAKRERSPLGSYDEAVEIFGEEGYWRSKDGKFDCASPDPLDELSFLYFIRTLPLEDGATYGLSRHFDQARNPVRVRVVGRKVLPDTRHEGSYRTVLVEMRVPDSRQETGTSLLRVYLTDDEQRVPVRIESAMPIGGTMVMTLDSRMVR